MTTKYCIDEIEKLQKNVLDLDMLDNKLFNHINLSVNTINSLVNMVNAYGISLGIIYKNIDCYTQYLLKIKYLNNILPIVFEYDSTLQFIYIIFYNEDHSKYYLKIFINISDGAIIKYIENDRSGYIPSYSSDKISLKPGEYLVHFSHRLLSYIGFNRVTLEDESYLITRDSNGNEMRTKLWLWYLIFKGKSWYGKFGYEPGNCSITEYHNALSDVKLIKLNDVTNCLMNIINEPNKNLIDPHLLNISEKIIKLIGDSDETLGQYASSHTLEDFTNLTNYLSQSIYNKQIYLQQIENSDNDESIIKHQYIAFPWFEKYKKLLVANVIQVNNTLYSYRLSSIS